MNVFEALITKFRTLQVDEITQSAVDKETLEFIEELNREQLQNSQNIKGDSLGEYHSSTVNVYNNQRSTKVSLGEDVKLYDTGQLYKSIKAEQEKDSIKVSAEYNESILGYLEEKYGEFIGLTKENKEYVSTKLLPKVAIQLKKKLLSKI